jgi:hypothetical protein
MLRFAARGSGAAALLRGAFDPACAPRPFGVVGTEGRPRKFDHASGGSNQGQDNNRDPESEARPERSDEAPAYKDMWMRAYDVASPPQLRMPLFARISAIFVLFLRS